MIKVAEIQLQNTVGNLTPDGNRIFCFCTTEHDLLLQYGSHAKFILV